MREKAEAPVARLEGVAVRHLAIIVGVACAVMAKQLVQPGLYSCVWDDTVLYLNWVRQFSDSLSAGIPYPRWLPDSHGGYGSPTFVFYPPLAIYAASLLNIATGDIVVAVNLAKFFGYLLSGLFMYLFVADIWGGKAGAGAAVAYLVLPYRVFDNYYLGIHASKLAFMWFPVVMHMARKSGLAKDPIPYCLGLASAFCLLCLTHPLSAYMIGPVALVFGLLAADRRRMATVAVALILALAAGLLLAAFYLLPALAESRYVHSELFLDGDQYQYFNNYLFGYDRGPLARGAEFNGVVALAILASTLPGLAALLCARNAATNHKATLISFAVVGAIVLLLMTPLSGLVWALTPGMRYLQFPARWSSVLTLVVACLVGAMFRAPGGQVARRPGRREACARIAFVGVSFLAATFSLYTIAFGCVADRKEIASYPADLDAREYVPSSVPLSTLQHGSAPDDDKTAVVAAAGAFEWIGEPRWSAESRELAVRTVAATTIRIRTFDFPGWRAEVDGTPATLRSELGSGAMLLDLDRGEHRVALAFGSTPVRRAACLVSMATLVALIVCVAGCLFGRQAYQSSLRSVRNQRP